MPHTSCWVWLLILSRSHQQCRPAGDPGRTNHLATLAWSLPQVNVQFLHTCPYPFVTLARQYLRNKLRARALLLISCQNSCRPRDAGQCLRNKSRARGLQLTSCQSSGKATMQGKTIAAASSVASDPCADAHALIAHCYQARSYTYKTSTRSASMPERWVINRLTNEHMPAHDCLWIIPV